MSFATRINTKSAAQPLDTDKLYMVDRVEAVDAAHKALSAIQDERPEVAYAAAAILMRAFTQRCKTDPFAAHVMAGRLMRDAEGYRRTNASVQSMMDFMGLRIVGDPNTSIS